MMAKMIGRSLHHWWVKRGARIRFLLQTLLVTVSLFVTFATPHIKAGTIYVTNRGSGDLSILRESSPKVEQVLPIGQQPWGVGVTKDNKKGCVSYLGGLAILERNKLKMQVERHVRLDGQGMGVAISPDGNWCYVAVNGNGGDRVLAVERSSGKIKMEASIGPRAFGVYLSPDGQTLYVPEHAGGALSVIETRFFTVLQRIPLEPLGEDGYSRPHYLAMTADGKTLYLPFVGQALVKIDTASLSVTVHPLSINAHQHGIALSPDGDRIYLANNDLGGEGSLSEIDANTLEELRRFPLKRHYEQVLVDSEGSHVYLSGGFIMGYQAHDDLTVVSLKDGKILHIKVKGLSPFHLFRAP